MSMKIQEGVQKQKYPGVKPGNEYQFQRQKSCHSSLFGYKMRCEKLAEIRHEVTAEKL